MLSEESCASVCKEVGLQLNCRALVINGVECSCFGNDLQIVNVSNTGLMQCCRSVLMTSLDLNELLIRPPWFDFRVF